MKDHTTNPSARKTPNNLVLRWLNVIGSKVFQADDRRAHEHVWEITLRRGGLARSYRDPRFNYLTSCQTCNGSGDSPSGGPCSGCHGTGRIVLDTAEALQPGRRS